MSSFIYVCFSVFINKKGTQTTHTHTKASYRKVKRTKNNQFEVASINER